MSGLLEIPGSGQLRTTTAEDVTRARDALAVTPAPRSVARISRGAITASAESPSSAARRDGLIRLGQDWQWRAMRYYRTIGECWNPAQYYSRAMERIRFFPAVINSRGIAEEVTSGPLLDLFRRIQSPGGAPGDLSEIAGTYGRLQFVIGDGRLTVTEDQGEEVWEYLSPMELRLVQNSDPRKPQEFRRLRAPGAVQEELHEAPDSDFDPAGIDQARVWRLWRRHPEYSQWADSPIRPVLDLYELLARLTLAATAEASSRAAQRGLFFWPDELSYGPVDSTQEENPDEDPLTRDMQKAMARAIQNPDSAEAMAPFWVRGQGVTQTSGGAVPTKNLMGWVALGPTDRYAEAEMWESVISRIAASIDLPKEMLTGIEDVSHWSAWFLDEVGFRQHTGPTVIRFCNDIASAYLRPAAIKDGIRNAEMVTVGFDASGAINHPDETGVVATAHRALVVSDAYYREKIGAPDDAAPNEEELARRVAILLKEFPSDLEPDPATGETPPPAGGRGGDVEEGPPADTQERPAGNRPPSPAPSMALRIEGAAMMAVDRARELAGNRLLRRSQSCDDCKDRARGVPPMLVAATFGPDLVRSVLEGHAPESALVDGIGESFARRLEDWNIDGGWSTTLGQMVEQHALRTLYEHKVPSLPPGFMAACQRAVN